MAAIKARRGDIGALDDDVVTVSEADSHPVSAVSSSCASTATASTCSHRRRPRPPGRPRRASALRRHHRAAGLSRRPRDASQPEPTDNAIKDPRRVVREVAPTRPPRIPLTQAAKDVPSGSPARGVPVVRKVARAAPSDAQLKFMYLGSTLPLPGVVPGDSAHTRMEAVRCFLEDRLRLRVLGEAHRLLEGIGGRESNASIVERVRGVLRGHAWSMLPVLVQLVAQLTHECGTEAPKLQCGGTQICSEHIKGFLLVVSA